MFSASKTAGPSGYAIQRSVRLRSSAGAYFTRTPATTTNKTTYTISAWVKKSGLGAYQTIMQAYSSVNVVEDIRFQNDDTISFGYFNGGNVYALVTTQLFRDPSAWYHVIGVVDSTNATSTERVRLYVNGVRITAFTTAVYPAQNTQMLMNGNILHLIGANTNNGLQYYLNGYLTEFNFIDGQALTPSSFGAYNSTTGVWQPKAYTGTYGTNGFFLNFKDNTSTTTLGYDYSGNSNNWTANNVSLTAGTTYDSMTDVPTLTSATQANYSVLNPLNKNASGITVLDGNLGISTSVSNVGVAGTIGVSTGKWYWETTFTNASGTPSIGAAPSTWDKGYVGDGSGGGVGYHANGIIYNNGTNVQSGLASYTSGDVIGVALDMGAGSITFYKNNVQQGTTVTGLTGEWFPAVAGQISSTLAANFGQRPFTYTPPTGYNRLNTYNLATPTIPNGAAQFAATLYTGTGATLTVANTVNTVNFQPDFVWIKGRSGATSHDLYDSVRGTTKQLIITTAAETTEATGLTAFGSTGFTVGALASLNTNAATYVAWQWKASNTTAVTNTAGSITSSVSANPTAGFSVVTYTGTGANATVGHGLGIAPKLILAKSRTVVQDWTVYHASVGAGSWLQLNGTGAALANGTVWNSTAPTSSVFSVGTASVSNPSASGMVAYCFAEIAGFSKFGSYTGNASADGPFVYTGFRPRYVCIKESSAARGWIILDTSRDTYNVAQNYLFAETSAAEGATTLIDILSNGFKVRSTNLNVNDTTSSTFIFFAFAENPFNYSLAR